jgi:NAD-dependent dihydropyrimidine dehydrogenase PreA subunit
MISSYTTNTLQYNVQFCTGCGMCQTVCPHGVFAVKNGKAQVIDYQACMECGACQLNCPANAIKVDSGVGCAMAMIRAALKGKKEATCGGDSCNTKPAAKKENTCGCNSTEKREA